jgi:hypothetical protein
MNRTLKLALAALGALAVAAGVVVLTVAATGSRISLPSQPATSTPATGSVPSPAATPATGQGPANPAALTVRKAAVQAEAQALGMQPKDLVAGLRKGQTVHQLADQKGLSQGDFQAQFTRELTVLLDQDVQQGSLTAQQEQQALKRLASGVPNWDQAAKTKQP